MMKKFTVTIWLINIILLPHSFEQRAENILGLMNDKKMI